ncbi:MAG: hypothetical protein ACWGMZ_03150 [Thermoguttaceae bacterium]
MAQFAAGFPAFGWLDGEARTRATVSLAPALAFGQCFSELSLGLGRRDGLHVREDLIDLNGKRLEYLANTAGPIDPLKVVRTALQNAASIAGLMLMTETLVTDFNKDDKEKRLVEGSVR